MKKKWFRKVMCMMLSVAILLTSMGFTVSAASDGGSFNDDNPYHITTLEEMQKLVGTLSYDEYIKKYEGVKPGTATVVLNGNDFRPEQSTSNVTLVSESQRVQDAIASAEGGVNGFDWADFNYDVNKDLCVYLPATGKATWQFPISKSEVGMYYIKIEYYSCVTAESSVSAIERSFTIDGSIPFSQVANVALAKDWTLSYKPVVETTAAPGEPDSYDISYKWKNEGAYHKIVTKIENEVKTVTTYTIQQDNIGNSMAPGAVPTPAWSTYYLQDETGYTEGYFQFYMSEHLGHTITLEAERDPVIIKSITLEPALPTESAISYEEYLAKYADRTDLVANGADSVIIEAEFPDVVSDASVAPSNDNTSAVTYPVVSGTQLYNVIGETGFDSVGQWASYKFRVNKTGFYNFGMRFKQSSLQGMYLCRSIKLEGGEYGANGTPTAPFKEANDIKFDYSDGWQTNFATDGNDEFRFFFEEGVEYTLYLECSLGTLKKYIQDAENALNLVNAAYLRILQLTGTDPDEYNDTYNFIEVMPDVLITILEQAKVLKNVHEELKEICGTNGAHIATLETVYTLFNKVGSDNGDNIAANLSNLKSYLGSLGTWINDSKASIVMIDSIVVSPCVEKDGEIVSDASNLPRQDANFFESMWFEIVAFFSSFVIDYDQMGVTEEVKQNAEHIDVWISAGRDQSQIWRTMIDAKDGFTDKTGVSVALKLVAGGTLLPSILSRKGPDVYLGLGSSEIINYAIREAVLGVNGLDPRMSDENNAVFTTEMYTYKTENGFVTVTEPIEGAELTFTTLTYDDVVNGNFATAALDTIMISPGIRKDGDTITALPAVAYGIPRTMQFAMMFYRMDILAELGLEIPRTWDDLLTILPDLQSNNMQIGVGHTAALDFMIYQEGGSMWKYTDTSKYDAAYAGAAIDLDSELALAAFHFTCRLYSDFSFPISFDTANRFRTGEMPITIGSYADVYNQLVVYATELSGLWEFCPLPGSYREDTGEFNYDSLAQVTATIILKGCDTRGNMREAWQFVQWETDDEQSANYGNRIVAIMGPSAKYETANLHAIDDLSWTASEKQAIMDQMAHMSSIVNYPGSYIISRYMQFAFLDAVNNDANAIDAMRSYIGAINSEIQRKRAEFGLWVPTEEEPVPPEKTASSSYSQQ